MLSKRREKLFCANFREGTPNRAGPAQCTHGNLDAPEGTRAGGFLGPLPPRPMAPGTTTPGTAMCIYILQIIFFSLRSILWHICALH